MNTYQMIKPWLLTALVAVFLSACASSSQEEIMGDDGSTMDGQSQNADGTSSSDGTMTNDDGIGATGYDDGESTAIIDTAPLTAAEMLEQTEGDLSDRTIYFEYDSAKLTSESIAILETHGNFIASNGDVSVRLEGHADERGSREYNIALGDRRAQSVRRVLLFQGASSDQVETVSYGEEKPAVSGHDEDAWSQNRRVELIYTVN